MNHEKNYDSLVLWRIAQATLPTFSESIQRRQQVVQSARGPIRVPTLTFNRPPLRSHSLNSDSVVLDEPDDRLGRKINTARAALERIESLDHENGETSTSAKLQLLQQIGGFATLKRSQLRSLATACEYRCFSPSTCIAREGEMVQRIVFILDGECEVSKQAEGDEQANSHRVRRPDLRLAYLGCGELIGESVILQYSDDLSALTGEWKHSYTVRTLSRCHTLILNYVDFHRQLKGEILRRLKNHVTTKRACRSLDASMVFFQELAIAEAESKAIKQRQETQNTQNQMNFLQKSNRKFESMKMACADSQFMPMDRGSGRQFHLRSERSCSAHVQSSVAVPERHRMLDSTEVLASFDQSRSQSVYSGRKQKIGSDEQFDAICEAYTSVPTKPAIHEKYADIQVPPSNTLVSEWSSEEANRFSMMHRPIKLPPTKREKWKEFRLMSNTGVFVECGIDTTSS